ncbi:Triose-phosphate Transporter family/UAA transporter family [Novymonas esmeraldas]|uniref:Triose-phosphate Transporter family/UAA transporter family n=1 Tax=Novymonas esmeraldas TaxID=1808958 RepID=A0AAW0EWW4_9TRYP
MTRPCALSSSTSASRSTSPPPPPLPKESSTAAAASASTWRLCTLATGVVVFHVSTSALQEKVFHLPGFTSVLLLSCGETCFTTVLVGLLLLWRWRRERAEQQQQQPPPQEPHTPVRSAGRGWSDHDPQRGDADADAAALRGAWRSCCSTLWRIFHPSTVSMHWYARIALLVSCSLYITNRSSLVLSYTLQVIFKSSKLLCMLVVHRWWTAHRDGGGGTGSAAAAAPVEAPARTVVSSPTARRCVALPSQPHPRLRRCTSSTAVADASATLPHHDADDASSMTTAATTTAAAAAAAVVVVAVPQVSWRVVGTSHPLEDDQPPPPPWWWTWLFVLCCGAALGRLCGRRRHRSQLDRRRHGRRRLDDELDDDGGSAEGAVSPQHSAAVAWRSVTALLQALGQRCWCRTATPSPEDLCRGGSAVATAPTTAAHVSGNCWGSMLVAAAAWLRGFLRDTEMLACLIIVVGLIVFTYASQHDVRVPSEAGAAEAAPSPWNASSPSPADAGATAAPSLLLQLVADATSFLSTRTVIVLIGVAGLLLSNVFDSMMYVLEELHCFHPRPPPPPPPPPRRRHAAMSSAEDEVEVATRSSPVAAAAAGPLHDGRSVPQTPVAHEPPGAWRSAAAAAAAAPVVPASPQEVLFMVNGIATLLYGASFGAAWLCARAASLLSPRSVGSTAVGAVWTALEAQQLAACELHRRTAALSTDAGLPAGCAELAARQRELQSLQPLWLASPHPAALTADTYSAASVLLLIAAASVTSLLGTLCLLRIVSDYTGVVAVAVTSVRKTLTILISFFVYGRAFTALHAAGLAGVMGGVYWYEAQRRRRQRDSH